MKETNADIKAWYTSKTLWLGVLTVVIGTIESLANDSILTEEAKSWALVIVGVLTVFFRLITDTALGKKTE